MSYAVDANILLYASDTSSPQYRDAHEFLTGCTKQSELWYVPWSIVMAYLRIATHPRIFSHPLTPREAAGNIQSLLQLPQVRPLSEAEGFFDMYQDVMKDFPVRGNLVPDAHLAALLRQHEVRKLYTMDRDFRKFDFLDVRNPLT